MTFTDKEFHIEHDNLKDKSLKKKIFVIIFGTNTPAGKLFDILLLILIVVNVLAVMLESVDFIQITYGSALRVVEWVITILFTIEYILRIIVVSKPRRYIFSFLGIIDLLTILPTFLSLIVASSQALVMIRVFRVLRVFRILKLARFIAEAQLLGRALLSSRHKITVFGLFLLVAVSILGSIMYFVEGGKGGFKSIPLSIYWAIVTMTTVGFGDITPVTTLGKMIASLIMLLGYSIIAIPTGIVGAEVYRGITSDPRFDKQLVCEKCSSKGHRNDSIYCRKCGGKLKYSQQK